jgi:hypothetical protein
MPAIWHHHRSNQFVAREEPCGLATNEMTEMESRTTTPALRKMVEAGDAKAIQAALAFASVCLELSLEVPSFSGSCRPCMLGRPRQDVFAVIRTSSQGFQTAQGTEAAHEKRTKTPTTFSCHGRRRDR